MPYPTVEPQPNLPVIEQGIQAFWEADRTFEASIAARPAGSTEGLSDNEYVFYDGPPFANGLPHYGHLLTGYVKDLRGRNQGEERVREVERALAGLAPVRAVGSVEGAVPPAAKDRGGRTKRI